MSRYEQIFLSLAVLVCAGIYYPVLEGLPIWDDIPEIFLNSGMGLTYVEIFTNYAWPSTQALFKFLLSVFGEQYQLYHALNLTVHLLNSLILYNILSTVNFTGRWAVFLLFLFHPANTMTVSWMVQIKTLVCFFFAAIAVRSFLVVRHRALAKGALALFYMISLTFKSSSLPLPALFLIRARSAMSRRNIVLLILSALICAAFFFRLFSSGEVFENSQGILKDFSILERLQLVFRIIRYYVVQAVLPFNTIPVKQLYLDGVFWDILMAISLCVLLFLGRRELWGRLLLVFLLLLVPFLSIIPAPYMNHTYVGDQHLYLALPFALAVLVSFPLRNEASRVLAVCLLLTFYVHKVSKTIEYYEDDPAFYGAILDAYPESVSMALNLAGHYYAEGRVTRALGIIRDLEERAREDERMRRNSFMREVPVIKEIMKTGKVLEPNKDR